VKKFIPTCRTEIHRLYQASLSGESCSLRLHNLENKDYSIGKWITQQLCLKGWQPFAVTSYPSYSSTSVPYGSTSAPYEERQYGVGEVLHFRFEIA
jgi:hypothetical protein